MTIVKIGLLPLIASVAFFTANSASATQQDSEFGGHAANVTVLEKICTEYVKIDPTKLEAFNARWKQVRESTGGEQALTTYGMTLQLLKSYYRVNGGRKFKAACENSAKSVIFGLGKETPVMIDNLPPELQEKLK